MNRLLARLADVAAAHRRLIVGAWVLVVVATVAVAALAGGQLSSGGYGVPGSGSAAVERAVAGGQFGGRSEQSMLIAVRGAPGTEAGSPAFEAAVRAAAARLTAEPGIRGVAPVPAAPGADPLVRLYAVDVAVGYDAALDLAPAWRSAVDRRGADAVGGVETILVGQTATWAEVNDLSESELASAESIGLPAVLVVLLLVIGAAVAASLPLVIGALSVGLTLAVLAVLARTFTVSVFATNMASLIGLGVAVDYSLFVLARYRAEVAGGAARDAARRTAMRTSGHAVAFSGATVVVALAAVLVIDSTALRSMAVGAIIVVGVAVVAALTLLPALLALLGDRVERFALPWARRTRSEASESAAIWARLARWVMRRPIAVAAVTAAVLLALAAPALTLRVGGGGLRQLPPDSAARTGAAIVGQAAGPGAIGPFEVMVTPAAAAPALRDAMIGLGPAAFASVAAPQPSADGSRALVSAQGASDPEDPATRTLAARVEALAPPGARVDVGGAPGQGRDFIDLVNGNLWLVALLIVAATYLVLLGLLRSVLLPLKAVIMTGLTVLAAYGVLSLVYIHGVGPSWIGATSTGEIDVMVPVLLLATVFGLSMDYEVFLLSRIRERYDAHGDTERAVVEGISHTARTITSAAAIMVVVFAAFVTTSVPVTRQLGLGLAVAIALDATVVRLLLVPATMRLLGRWNWWMPGARRAGAARGAAPGVAAGRVPAWNDDASG